MTELQPYNSDEVAKQVWHLRKGGMGWEDIRDRVAEDYGSVLTLRQIADMYRDYLVVVTQMFSPEDRKQELAIELERLNDLHGAFWTHALAGDKDAAKVVLDVARSRHKLLGLDLADAANKSVQQAVLIIGDDKAEWIAALANGRNQHSLPGPAGDDGEDTEEER